jgi:molybdopterin converting factor small subunit
MNLHVFVYATLRRHLPGYDPYQGLALEVSPGTTAGQVLERLGLPREEVTIILVDGVQQGADYALRGGERLGMFPQVGGG